LNATSAEFSPEFPYYITGDFNVTLSVFYQGLKISSTQTITVNPVETPLNMNLFEYEKTINMANAQALNGWEDSTNLLVFHVINPDDGYYVGLIEDNSEIWHEKNQYRQSFVKRTGKGKYTHLIPNTIYNFDFSNNKTDSRTTNTDYYYNCNSNNQCLTYSYYKYNNNYPSGDRLITVVLDHSNELIDSNYYFYISDDILMSLRVDSLSICACIDTICTDYILKYDYYEERIVQNQSGTYYSMRDYSGSKFNGRFIPYTPIYSDILRLSDSVLVLTNPRQLVIGHNRGIRPAYGVNDSIFTLIVDTTYNSDFIFNHFQRINDTTILAAGSYKNQPAYFLFNDLGEIVKIQVIPERFGEINFASFTCNNNLLLSGWRYSVNMTKIPYFVSVKETVLYHMCSPLIYFNPLSDISEKPVIDINAEPLCFPNPTTQKATISFNSSANTTAKATLYDPMGNEIQSQEILCSEGVNSLDFSFSLQSSGMYYYRLFVGGRAFSGKIVYIKE
jgi:hypothetical protein